MAARILPSDDGPGAREAGVVHFIDRALATFVQDQRPLVTAGLTALATVVAQRHPGVAGFAALQPADQDDVLRAVEAGDFFQFVRWGTLAGFLANPSYAAITTVSAGNGSDSRIDSYGSRRSGTTIARMPVGRDRPDLSSSAPAPPGASSRRSSPRPVSGSWCSNRALA